ncbi:MAG: KEOPS complex subunit Cgi121, partial [Salinarchaeum sp.]
MANLIEAEVDATELQAVLDSFDRIGTAHDCTVQAVDARYVAGREHVQTAVNHATRALARGNAIAHDPGVELLLYLAGTRQIERAMEIGLDAREMPAVIVVAPAGPAADIAGATQAVRDLPQVTQTAIDVGDPEQLMAWFDIDDAEQAATATDLETLVCERVALLAVES